MNFNFQFNNKSVHFPKLFAILVFSILVTACSSSLPISEPLESADDFKQGPGVFSGSKGAFYVVGGDKNKAEITEKKNSSVTYYQKPVSKMDLNETSKVLDEKIKQLERDQMELELLKREVDKKLKN
jgi:hypothetical protein